MKVIKIKLLGHQSIIEDGKDVYLPPGKLSGLFFYILIKGVVSRDEVANLFWPDSNEKRAKTSLRNAIHKIRNYFDSDIILSPTKFDLSINDDLLLELDTESLEKNPLLNYGLYEGEFLKGLYIDNLLEFDYWLNEMREYYLRIYRNALEKKLDLEYASNKFVELEHTANTLISLDVFNENAYYYKLLYYKKIDRFDKIINEYHNFQNLINRELGILPSENLNIIYEEALEKVSLNKKKFKKKETVFFKRDYEIKLMEYNFKKFIEGKSFESILITGEAGTGKTVLKEMFLKNITKDCKVINLECNYLEKNIPYYPWIKTINMLDEYFKEQKIKSPDLWEEVIQSLFLNSTNKYQPSAYISENLSNFNMEIIFSALLNAFKIYGEGLKIVISFDDIHLVDKLSMELIVRFILSYDKNIMFLLVSSDKMDSNTLKTFETLEDLNKVLSIILKRFTKQDVCEIIYSVLGEDIDKKDIDDIYNKSKGNAFFLNEYINIYSKNESEENLISKVDNVLKESFSLLSEEDLKILRILSVCYEPLELDVFISSFNIEAFQVLRCVENLTKLNIVEEYKEGEKVKIRFTYSAYKEYIYNTLKEGSKKIIHLEVANNLEKMISDTNVDIATYNKLEKHFKKAGNMEKALKYKIYKLNYFLNFSHEVFPNLNDYKGAAQVEKNIKNNKAIELIEEAEKEIMNIKNQVLRINNKDIIDEIEMIFLYCKGRYLIRCGKYEDGIRVINRLIFLSKQVSNIKFELLGRKQLIIYGIQINNQDIMIENIVPGIDLAEKIGNTTDLGVLYRLNGLYNMMIGNLEKATKLFKDSINIFLNSSILGNENPISIAANYNYIGEIKTAERNFEKGMEYYKKAISLAEDLKPTCISIFYINAGISCFLVEDIENMREYFNKAEKVIKQFDSYWKKPVLNAFLGLIEFLDENFEDALVYLQDAESEVSTINNPRDVGIIYFVQTIIAFKVKEKNLLQNKKNLKESLEYYYYKAIKHLDPYREKSEIQYLKEKITL